MDHVVNTTHCKSTIHRVRIVFAGVVVCIVAATNLIANPTLVRNHLDLSVSADKIGKQKVPARFHRNAIKTDANDKTVEIVDGTIHIRGQGCLRASRKCYTVKTKKAVRFTDSITGKTFKLKRFYLISMWEDISYTTTWLGYSAYQKHGLFPVRYAYLTLTINNRFRGLYLVVENPKHALKKKKKSPFVLRRGYLGLFTVKAYNEKRATIVDIDGNTLTFTEREFKDAYRRIARVKTKKGKEGLFEFLSQRMNIDRYMHWLALNTFLKNGDYLDEVYFYASISEKGKLYFDIMGWDPDALFKKPHFGIYNTVRARYWRNRSLLYSLEAKLDRTIASDAFLYKKFTEHLQTILEAEYTDSGIDAFIDNAGLAIAPYMTPAILEASKRGGKTYTASAIKERLETRRVKLKARRLHLLRRLRHL